MKQFLFCSTVLLKKQYTVMTFEDKDNVIEKMHYLLTHREDAVFWPLFVKSDIEELVLMEPSLTSQLKGIQLCSGTCKIRYNGWTYEIDEITLSKTIKGYWKCSTNCGNRLFDPEYIEFVGTPVSLKQDTLTV